MQQGVKTQIWNDILDIVHNYLHESSLDETSVVEYHQAEKLKNLLDLKLQDSAATDSEILEEVKKYLKYSVRTTHPLYNNQLNSGSNFESLIGEVVSFITNTTMATFEVAPVATLMEEKLIEELNSIIGFDNGEGIMLTGGSNANMMAIHAARNERFPNILEEGNISTPMKVFISKEAHYSHKKAMMLLGLGTNNLISVKADDKGKMDPADLELKITECIQADHIPLLVCSTAGTTVQGAFDPIKEINAVCKKYQVWHHIDGAWGGAVMFSKKYKHLLAGIEGADSYTFDAHKLLGTGLITSFFLSRKKGVLKAANSGGGSQYIFHNYENADYDTGRKSLQCGRKVDSLKFWLTWKSRGHSGLEEYVDEQYAKRDYLVEKIKAHPRLKLIHDPQYLNVCFQVIPEENNIDINKYNLDLRFKLVQSGKMMTNFSSWSDGTVFFRHIFANHETQNKHLDKLIDIIIDHS